MGLLVLVRHGESRWNQEDRFTGWVDVALTEEGVREAEICAERCQKYAFGKAFTSRLERAHETLHIILARQNKTGILQHHGGNLTRYRRWLKASNNLSKNHDIPVVQDRALNERYYGDLQGMKRSEARRLYGEKQVQEWRCGFAAKPPGGESLKMTFARVIPYFKRMVIPELRGRSPVLLVAHGNSLRAIIKSIEGMDDEGIACINLPAASPIVYQYRAGVFKRVLGHYGRERLLS